MTHVTTHWTSIVVLAALGCSSRAAGDPFSGPAAPGEPGSGPGATTGSMTTGGTAPVGTVSAGGTTGPGRPVIIGTTTPGAGGASSSGGAGSVVGAAGAPGPSVTVLSLEEGTPVDLELQSATLTELGESLEAVKGWSTQDLLGAYPAPLQTELGFSPSSAGNFDVIQASALGLGAEDLQRFEANGFVIPSNRSYSTFSYAYHTIYAEDLPVYVTADSVLDAWHRSYDEMLKQIEQGLLLPTLSSYLDGMQARLATANVPDPVRQDTALFLGVAEQLLKANEAAEVDAPEGPMRELVLAALEAAEKIEEVEIFGAKRLMDMSQFKPRGHYTDSVDLQRYFRAMIWLGRIDLRLIETLPDGSRVFRRRQAETSALLRSLMTEELLAQWKVVDDVVTTFVGEHDYMTVLDVDQLLTDLNVSADDPIAGLTELSDQQIAEQIIAGQYGEQRIASHAMVKSPGAPSTLPLSASFALFGQRYAVDSHVFSQVVFDRAATRVVPDPLDAAFAALGNDHAASLLTDQLDFDGYAPNLGGARILVDAHPAEYWDGSLYTLWLSGLRTLSAQGGSANPAAPSVAQTDAWGRRLLNTQLGSWAQLRHDTILYVKQSYTGGATCEYIDAYVDPYPRFWQAMQVLAEKGGALAASLPDSTLLPELQEYFTRFGDIVARLARMAENQETGTPHSAEDLAFINEAVVIAGGGSGPPTIEGWYHQLLFVPWAFSEVDNVVADVHTDIGGQLPRSRNASVLHVGTAYPRHMVVAVETCEGPRAYVGPVFNYKEYLADGLVRLNDIEWQPLISGEDAPDDPEWLAPVVGTSP